MVQEGEGEGACHIIGMRRGSVSAYIVQDIAVVVRLTEWCCGSGMT